MDINEHIEIPLSEKGQNVILIALMMMVFIGLLALVIDGGFSYSSRRAAQNAADAGALAGANQLCAVDPAVLPADAAWDYAVNRNGATDADINIVEHTIEVTATVPHQSFFAGLIGADVVTTTAYAKAGCYSPCSGTGVMPVAWACEPPVGGSDEDDCVLQYGTVDDPGPTYVVMDSNKAEEDYQCQDPPNSGNPPGTLDCDFIGGPDVDPADGVPDGDGVNDLIIGGGRSWLDLDGGSQGSNDLVDWIANGFDGDVTQHLWLPGTDGTSTNIFHEARLHVGELVILPVFNDFTLQCRPDIEPACSGKWHDDIPDEIHPTSAGSADYYHIISFSVFKITCVSAVPGQKCPAKEYLVDNDILDPQDKTIEGYFVEGYVPGLGGSCGYDAGAYTIYLDH
jgi:hypothetical protein